MASSTSKDNGNTPPADNGSYSDFLDGVRESQSTDDGNNGGGGEQRPWRCVACSYRNENPSHWSCAMCGTERYTAGLQTAAAAGSPTGGSPFNFVSSTGTVADACLSVPDDIDEQNIDDEHHLEDPKAGEGGAGKKRTNRDTGTVGGIEDESISIPTNTNNDDRLKMIEDGNTVIEEYFNPLHDEEMGQDFNKVHPAAMLESVTELHPQSQPHMPESSQVPSNSNIQEERNHNTRDAVHPALVRPTPQSMLQNPSEGGNNNNHSLTQNSVPMFEVEARLVEEESRAPTVFDARVVNPFTEDRLRRNQKYLVFGIVFLLCAVMVVVGILLGSSGIMGNKEDDPTKSPTMPTDSNISGLDEVRNSFSYFSSQSFAILLWNKHSTPSFHYVDTRIGTQQLAIGASTRYFRKTNNYTYR